MRRAGRALVAAVALLVVAGACGLAYLTTPIARARYHLRRVTPDEIVETGGTFGIKGHASAFCASVGARDVFGTEVVPAARRELEERGPPCYRVIFLILLSSQEEPFRADWLELAVRELDAEGEAERDLALQRLPLDARCLEAVLAHLSKIANAPRSSLIEIDATVGWLARYGWREDTLEIPWQDAALLKTEINRCLAIRDREVSVRGRLARLDVEHRAWLEAHRSDLPPQIR